MTDIYSHIPIIPRTGLDADLAGTTAIKNEMLWTKDTKKLYVEQDGEKVEVGGGGSEPSSSIPAISVQVLSGSDDCIVGDGQAYALIPSTLNGLDLTEIVQSCITPGTTGTMTIQINRRRIGSAMGDSTTQFDITDEGDNVFRYTYDSTGTDPYIDEYDEYEPSLRIGDVLIIQAQNFNAANNGRFVLTEVGSNYFEVSNASGVAENNKTIGTGYILPITYRDVLSVRSTIDSEEYDSSTALTAAVIDTDFDDVLTNDVYRIDVDTIHSGVSALGLNVALVFG
jgi:hypothetical protein